MAVNKPQPKKEENNPPYRVDNFEALARLYQFISISQVAKALGMSKETLRKRINRHTDMTTSTKRKADAYDMTVLLEEMRHELSVALGYEERDRHYEYKYLENLAGDLAEPIEMD